MSTGPGLHSPVGASAASTFLKCSLSVSGRMGIELDDEESVHAALGTAVHTLIETCFTQNIDAWQRIGHGEEEGWPFTVTREMVTDAQTMLDEVRKAHPDRNQGNFWVERRFHCKMIHELFYGTCDVLYLDEGSRWVSGEKCGECGGYGQNAEDRACSSCGGTGDKLEDWTTLHVWDYKNGAGVIVEVAKNAQEMYYACGALEEMELWDKVDEVVLHVVQPNAFHQDGHHRTWSTTSEELAIWLKDELIPGINRALTSSEAVAGPHCVFCPLRGRKCPAIMAEMEELYSMVAKLEKEGIGAFDNTDLGRLLDLTDRAAMVKKAALADGYNRAQAGQTVVGWKLVPGKKWRKWKDGAEDAAKTTFGDRALEPAAIKSPAEIDKLPLGTTFTAEWAQKPEAGLTLAKDADQRSAVKIIDKASLFTPVSAPVETGRSTRRKAA